MKMLQHLVLSLESILEVIPQSCNFGYRFRFCIVFCDTKGKSITVYVFRCSPHAATFTVKLCHFLWSARMYSFNNPTKRDNCFFNRTRNVWRNYKMFWLITETNYSGSKFNCDEIHLRNNLSEVYLNLLIALQTMWTTPVVVASTERCFSRLRLMK